MARGGNGNRLSTAQKKLQGTFRPDREPDADPVPPAKVGRPPSSFTAAQRRAWADLAPAVQRTFTENDRPTFILLAKTWAQLEAPEGKKTAPAYITAQRVRMAAQLLESFGCSPSSRRRADTPKDEDPPEYEDPLDEFAISEQ